MRDSGGVEVPLGCASGLEAANGMKFQTCRVWEVACDAVISAAIESGAAMEAGTAREVDVCTFMEDVSMVPAEGAAASAGAGRGGGAGYNAALCSGAKYSETQTALRWASFFQGARIMADGGALLHYLRVAPARGERCG